MHWGAGCAHWVGKNDSVEVQDFLMLNHLLKHLVEFKLPSTLLTHAKFGTEQLIQKLEKLENLDTLNI